MRLCTSHGGKAVEVFVYGQRGGAFPARQHVEASRAIARLHQLDPERTLFVAQSEEAIAAGAFHNDVVAVANENVLLAHEQAFEDRADFYASLKRLRSEEHTSELQSLMRISYAVFCLKKKIIYQHKNQQQTHKIHNVTH